MDLERVCARDWMTQKVVLAEPHEKLRSALVRMTENRIHGLLVRPESRARGFSILTGKDIVRVLCDVGEPALDELCVEDAMTRPAVSIPAELCIADCLRLMRMAGVRTAPVVERGELVGVLSFTDVLARLAAKAIA